MPFFNSLKAKIRSSSHSDDLKSIASSTEKKETNSRSQASDVVGDSPAFGSPASVSNSKARRVRSRSSDTGSFNNPRPSANVLKMFGGSTSKRRSSQATETSPAITQANEYFASSPSQGPDPTSSSAKLAVSQGESGGKSPEGANVGSLPSITTPTENGALIDAINANVPAAGLGSATVGAPRPSELFAGKGIQWDEINLTSRGPIQTGQSQRTEDLQSFLKARRQWIPTFKTDIVPDEKKTIDRIEDVQFQTSDVSKEGLLSLKDLEESHKRKKQLSKELPVFGTGPGPVFEESQQASGSGSGSNRPSVPAPPPPAQAPVRNQSFRSSTFSNSSTNGNGSSGIKATPSMSRKPVPAAVDTVAEAFTNDSSSSQAGLAKAQAGVDGVIPPVRTSSHHGHSAAGGDGSAGGGSLASLVGATSGNGPAAPPTGARQSVDTSTGFQTPLTDPRNGSAGALSETTKGLTLNSGTAGATVVPASSADAAAEVPPSSTSSTPASPSAPPRPPRADRTPTASRQNSSTQLRSAGEGEGANPDPP
ncbi:hypothetical protein IE53DRAFT_413620, partial [Violaceomyces palustris]